MAKYTAALQGHSAGFGKAKRRKRRDEPKQPEPWEDGDDPLWEEQLSTKSHPKLRIVARKKKKR
jgi:hypothetical protein